MASRTRKSLLKIKHVRGVAVVRLACEAIIGAEMVQAVGEAVDRLLEKAGPQRLVLNLEGVEFVTSAMLGKLWALQQKAEEEGGKMVLCSVSPTIRRILELTHFDRMLPIFPGEEDALRSFAPAARQ